ncbi:MAG: lysozyme inhibitor LprI family protein [Methylococcaceae bacterium]
MKKIVLGLVLFTPSVFAASFDCNKAATFIEKAICGNEEIGRLDDKLALNFKAAKKAIGDDKAKELIASQKQWLSVRNKCTDDKCLIDSYSKRIAVIVGNSNVSNLSAEVAVENKVNNSEAETELVAENDAQNLERAKQEAPISTAPVAVAAPVVVLPEVTADSIASAYSENTIAADLQFKGKKYKVTGTVTDISTDFRGTPYITLQSSVHRFMKPQFSFEESEVARLANLKKGSTVSLICIGKGDIAKTPMSGSCTLL